MINYIVHNYIDIKSSHVNWKTFVLKKLNIQNAKRHKIFKIPYYILRYLNRPLFSISLIISAWTFTILLSDIVNLFKYFYYMYTSLSTVKIKIKKKIRTIQLFPQKFEFTRRDRFLVWGRKKKKKIPKIGKKKNLKANHLSLLSLTKPGTKLETRFAYAEDCRTRDRADRASRFHCIPVERRYSEEAGSIWEPRRCSWHLAGIQLNIDPAPFSAGKQLCTLINAPPLSAQSNRIVLERTESNPTIPPPRWIIDPAGIYGAALPPFSMPCTYGVVHTGSTSSIGRS